MNTIQPQFVAILATAILGLSAMGAAPAKKTVQYAGFSEPIHRIRVAACEAGRIAEVIVRRGATVRKDDVLMVLDTNVLDSSRRIAQAKAKNSARIDALRIEHEIKQIRFEKLKELLDSGAGSPEETRRAEADASVAQLNVQSAIEDQRLSELELAEIEARIEQRRVRSPINGVVTEMLNEPGEYVSLNQPQVATVVQLGTLRVTFFIPTNLATRLAVDQRLELTIPGDRPELPGQHAVATIEYVGAVTEADSGRVRLDVLIDNNDGRYRSGVRCLFSSPN